MPEADEYVTSIQTIAVTGDVAIDHYEIALPPGKPRYTWQSFPNMNQLVLPGGALLLAEFLRTASTQNIVAPEMPDDGSPLSGQIVHSFSSLQSFPSSVGKPQSRQNVYRVKEYKGYSGPPGRPSTLAFDSNNHTVDMVVLDDAGNGFRQDASAWPAAIRDGSEPLVLIKLSYPLTSGSLWQEMQKKHGERLVIVVSADHLRYEGINISRQLSWERTAQDYIRQMLYNPKMAALGRSSCLVVRFGLDGAVLYTRNQGSVSATLFYDPNGCENDYENRFPGVMTGCGTAFAAALAAHIASGGGLACINEGIKQGILSARRLWKYGFGQDANSLCYPYDRLFQAQDPDDAVIASVKVPDPVADSTYWSILTSQEESDIENLAFDYVLRGPKHILTAVPCGQFRTLRTYDRSEIESYRSIGNLIQEYLNLDKARKPLSVAVFGAPGSGKSFGVTEVAESIAPGCLKSIEFNLSEFSSEKDLINAFHIVRDAVLSGLVPLVFFDEFDCSLNGKSLGWLKCFLAPMQNGRFRDGETVHPLGKSIFVFAGGIFPSLQELSQAGSRDDAGQPNPEFKGAKIPDFVSRLRGYVNIKGPNPGSDGLDGFYMIRRALSLRSLMKKNTPCLFDQDDRLNIDEGVLRAMIKTREYKHGNRSMAAIIDMSMLSGRLAFEQAALPSVEQMDLHVDAEMFYSIMEPGVKLAEANEEIARTLHELYCARHRDRKPPGDPSLEPWDGLLECFKESNRQQAADIMNKAGAAGYRLAASTYPAINIITFSDSEVELMAELEHERWNTEHFLGGWRYGEPRDDDAKIHDCLLPWLDLPEESKEWDREFVRAIPMILAARGFELNKIK